MTRIYLWNRRELKMNKDFSSSFLHIYTCMYDRKAAHHTVYKCLKTCTLYYCRVLFIFFFTFITDFFFAHLLFYFFLLSLKSDCKAYNICTWNDWCMQQAVVVVRMILDWKWSVFCNIWAFSLVDFLCFIFCFNRIR